MPRLLGPLATALLCTLASGQCFETKFGTLLGVGAGPGGSGDEVLFAALPLHFAFPLGGVAQSYTHLAINTNGAVFLSNGATPVGATATGYSTQIGTLVDTFRGSAGPTQSPRIAGYWRDLDLYGPDAGVYCNNALPGKCVVTWHGARHWNQSGPQFTFQVQLFASGRVEMFYDRAMQNTALVSLCGVSQGAAVADPGHLDLSLLGLTATSTKIAYQSFTTLRSFDLQNTAVSYVPNSAGGFDVTTEPCVPAYHESYGHGCYDRSATLYELFAANTIDLSGTSLVLSPNADGGYTIARGVASIVPPTILGLALGDDAIGTLALPSAFAYPGGATTSLSISSNGYVWMESPNVRSDFSPTSSELFTEPARLCAMWCDGVPDGARNVANVVAEVSASNQTAYVSWLDVPIFGTAGGRMNVQAQFDLATGAIEIHYGNVACGSPVLVGFSPGASRSVVDLGSQDLSAGSPAELSSRAMEQNALALTVSGDPVLGSRSTFTTTDVPVGAVFSLYVLSMGQFASGVDLGVLGAPMCSAYVSLPEVMTHLQIGGPTAQTLLNIPHDPFLAGRVFFSQALALDATANAAGLVVSNGIRSEMNVF
ncbi:MAG: hypothetical protein ABL997_02020 [Planctomycetota bacterium]